MSRWWTACLDLGLAFVLAACASDATDYGDPTEGWDAHFAIVAVSPAELTELESPSVSLVVTVGEGAAARVQVETDEGGAQLLSAVDPSAEGPVDFAGTVALTHGTRTLTLRATLPDGRTARRTHRLTWSGAEPGLAITTPAADASVSGLDTLVSGRVSLAPGSTLTRLCLSVPQTGLELCGLSPDDSGRFTARIATPQSSDFAIRASATDSSGHVTTVDRAMHHDPSAPTLVVSSPADGALLTDDAPRITVVGSASDAEGSVSVEVGLSGDTLEPATLAADGAFTAPVQLGEGLNLIVVRATDASGRVTSLTRAVSTPETITLRIPPAAEVPPELTLTLDRDGLSSLLPTENQDDIALFDLDMGDIVKSALDAIQAPAAWGLDPTTWTPAAQNMQRILVMTPETADLTGSAMAEVIGVTGALGIPEATVLSRLLDQPADTPFLPRDVLEATLVEHLLLTHPNITADPETGAPRLRVTMRDALTDMASLGEKLGPQAGHPGLVSGPPHALVMGGAFRMTVTARSNLRQRDAVDLGTGKAWLFERTAPAALDFDFEDPARYQLTGLVEEPAMSMGFLMTEAPTFLAGGTEKLGPGDLAADPFPRGASPAWAAAPWTFESLVIDSAYRAFRDLYPDDAYAPPPTVYGVGNIDDAATITWERGWVTIDAGGIVETPAPAYIWDTLVDVAQLRLHDGGIAEGQGDVVVPLEGIHVPLTGEQILEATRPLLAAQEQSLSDLMVGAQSAVTTPADIYMGRASSGAPELRVVGAAVAPAKPAAPKPGFYESSAISGAAVTSISPTVGLQRFVADEAGRVFGLTVLSVSADAVTLRVAAVAATNPGAGR
ncbi:MAG: hypothetical protein R3F39_08625 [Myxococcota bacterium]